ncbi:hypothetical protein OG244_20365 [Streptomyces brevispora]|uniref:hypothetical protein n=1 Tax=Streptomyces brevispora TaxID=887462 RepID=UPI002E3505BC|nr:hypothetical protein [Streptomyces brevispora]
MGDPRGVRGGNGFNDARENGQGVWRDRILPSRTLWYKVPAGWGRQVRYDVEFANEPTVDRTCGPRVHHVLLRGDPAPHIGPPPAHRKR